jgi:hypothetical protein
MTRESIKAEIAKRPEIDFPRANGRIPIKGSPRRRHVATVKRTRRANSISRWAAAAGALKEKHKIVICSISAMLDEEGVSSGALDRAEIQRPRRERFQLTGN